MPNSLEQDQQTTHGNGGDEGLSGMAAQATLHCLTGCAIGEIIGLVLGTAAGLGNVATTALAFALAFLFGYSLSLMPLLRAGLAFGAALGVVLAADTLSILTMEITDNAVMSLIPGAMDAGLGDVVFWIGMAIALAAAFAAAYPVNRVLLQRGKGHALTHRYSSGESEVRGARRLIPNLSTGALAGAVVAFLLGGLVVAAAGDLEGGSGAPRSKAPAAASA